MSGGTLMYSVLTVGLLLLIWAIVLVIRSYRRPNHGGLSAAIAGLVGAGVLLFLGWVTVGSYLSVQAFMGGPPGRVDPSSAAYREGSREGARLKSTTYLTYEDRHDRCYKLVIDAWGYLDSNEFASMLAGCYDGTGIDAEDVPALQLDYGKRHPYGGDACICTVLKRRGCQRTAWMR